MTHFHVPTFAGSAVDVSNLRAASALYPSPEVPSTEYLRFLVPKTINGVVFDIRYLEPLGSVPPHLKEAHSAFRSGVSFQVLGLRSKLCYEVKMVISLDTPNVPLYRALWSLLDGIWGVFKGSLGAAGGRVGFGSLRSSAFFGLLPSGLGRSEFESCGLWLLRALPERRNPSSSRAFNLER